ncbi:hypothetical protein [Tessaracoccus sp. ZS01]|uniref:hypothetical protein n=1 Tax=Tessaracoccus sp. ZS01 TaxID=1906324 RepID=UPI00096F1664|nr:hypothetical protein [Tessaracoccus sp. ZS01]MCG6566163.1 hypothetical protein [Tessaracoccus sp. ZS01]OMG58656.1 hypothetical protein BJN44_00740 [Tessaracoccus sp. ZS01]
MLIVRGATLAGLAASARLARLGHEVTLEAAGHTVDPLPQTIVLPATWRDLFKKSGAHLVTALNGAGLALTEAPPRRHHLSDGTTLDLPAERGAQYHALSATFGPEEAARWRDLLDDLLPVWEAFRQHALEGTEPVRTKQQRASLWLDRSVADVAERLRTPLSEVVLSLGPENPGTAALPLLLERMFGRWQVTDDAGAPQPAERLVGLLRQRVAERGVRTVDSHDGPADIDCRPHVLKPHWWQRRATLGTPIDDGRQLRASVTSPAGEAPWGQLASAALAVYALHERLTGEDPRPTNKAFTPPRLGRRG